MFYLQNPPGKVQCLRLLFEPYHHSGFYYEGHKNFTSEQLLSFTITPMMIYLRVDRLVDYSHICTHVNKWDLVYCLLVDPFRLLIF